jgi:hypothetical protein
MKISNSHRWHGDKISKAKFHTSGKRNMLHAITRGTANEFNPNETATGRRRRFSLKIDVTSILPIRLAAETVYLPLRLQTGAAGVPFIPNNTDLEQKI